MEGVERMVCTAPACDFVHWDNPIPVVAALVQYREKIILARNAQWPDGMFSLLTGFLERNETPEQAVVREVKEEIGLEGEATELIGCYPLLEKNQIILAFSVKATGELVTDKEIAQIKLVSREELRLWQFDRLVLTSAIVRGWLNRGV